jgi:SH3-like domain-containing protein
MGCPPFRIGLTTGVTVRKLIAALAFVVLGLSSVAQTAQAAGFRSMAAPAVLYDAPSRQASKVFVAPRGMPVEVISTVGVWIKVRDLAGDVAWVERSDLAERRTVVAATLATVRQQPQEGAAELLQVERGVLLDLADPPAAQTTAGWLKVRHREAGVGWVRTADIWGW